MIPSTAPRAVAPVLGFLLLVGLVPSVSPALPAQKPIQPGAQVQIAGSLCTLNYVFARGSTRYVGTAGHCASNTGQRASTDGAGSFGTVVFRQDDDALDFALIQIDQNKLNLVEPSVRGFGGPTGITTSSDASIGDLLSFHGYGLLLGATAATRPRPGVLVGYGSTHYSMDAPAVNGDSGAPVLHTATGRALGIISVYGLSNIPPTTDLGPTVAHIRARLQAAGYNVSLVTAAY